MIYGTFEEILSNHQESPDMHEEAPMDTEGGAVPELKDTDSDFDDVETEAKKIEAPRCTKCRRMTSGHEGPCGSKCGLKILNADELREDDIKKVKDKEKKTLWRRKWRRKKMKKTSWSEPEKSRKRFKGKFKMKKQRVKIERETRKMEREFDEEAKKNAKQYNK
jgi:hypothetical protein